MKSFRTVVFWCHLLTGILAAVVVLIMSVTGVLLTYEKQVMAWANTRAHTVAPPSADTARKPSVEAVIRNTISTEGEPPTLLTVRANPKAPWEAAYGRERTVFVNPHTGEVMGNGAVGVRRFFRTVTDWHRWLAASGERRDVGKAVTGASNLGFLFLVVSGLYLWWPRNWARAAVRNVTQFRRGLSGRARDFNWHNVLGFWFCVPLFLVVLSATVISYPWASNLVFRAAGEAPPVRRGPPREGGGPGGNREAERVSLEGLDRAWARAEGQVPGWKIISLRSPAAAGDELAFTVDRGTGGQPHLRDRLTLDRNTGEIIAWEPYASNTRGQRARSFLRFAHTGEVAGIIGQTVAGLASAAGAVLVWTGLALTWRRFRSWRARRSPGNRRGMARPIRIEDEPTGVTSAESR